MRPPRDLADARTLAYAIYVLTREGFITTNYILNLRDYLDKQFAKQWPQDLTGVYLAGAWSILKKDDEANRLIATYRLGAHDKSERTDFYQPLGTDAQYFAIVARHFPDRLKHISAQDFQVDHGPDQSGRLQYALRGLCRVGVERLFAEHRRPPRRKSASRKWRATNTRRRSIARLGGQARDVFSLAPWRSVSRPRNSPTALGVFYQVVEAGFDRTLPEKAIDARARCLSRVGRRKGEAPSITWHSGQPVTVKLTARSLTNDGITNVALIDLLPGGFEILRDSVRGKPGGAPITLRLRRSAGRSSGFLRDDSDHGANDHLSDQGDESRRVCRAAALMRNRCTSAA